MGLAKSRLYRIWQNMKSRCGNFHNPAYCNYGGRGIEVCEDWRQNFREFEKWAIESGYSDTLTIDRIDVNGNYEPHNCRWIPKEDQPKNRRNNIFVEGKTLRDIAEESGIPYVEVKSRYYRGHRTIRELSSPLVRPSTVDGKTLQEIVKETGISYETLKVRYRNGARDYETLTKELYRRA